MSRDESISAGQAAEEAMCQLLQLGRHEEAFAQAEAALAQDPKQDGDDALVARLHVIRFAALLNLERYDQCPPVADALYNTLSRCDEPALLGEYHALAGILAYSQSALDRCVMNLVRGARALERVRVDSREAADAWRDLAATYSYIGFHEEALATLARAQQVGANAGAPAIRFVAPSIQVQHALWLDHQGDTEGCVRELSELYTGLTPDQVVQAEWSQLAYAGARLVALGVPVERDPAALLATCPYSTPQDAAVFRVVESCLAIAAGRPAEALSGLDAVGGTDAIPVAELLRVRALALAAAGDYRAALRTERAAVAAIVNGPGRLNSLYIEGITARLDQDELRRSLSRYTDEAHTDSLTGLPNRRHLERYVNDLTSHGTYGTIGVADLNGFKAINTVHGHLSGDEVLQQVAALLTRALRSGDFLARYGGDEFVVILPETGLDDAADVSGRLINAVDRFDWAALVPATPVSLSIGLAELDPRTDFSAAFQVADLVMLQEKAGGGAR